MIFKNTNLAPGALVSDNAYIDDVGKIDIDENAYIGGHVKIYRHHHNETRYVWNMEMENKKVVFPLKIGESVFIGFGAMVLPSCQYIGKNSIIGAMSVVTKDIPDNEIWAGNPARFIRKRNIINGVDQNAKPDEKNFG